MYSPATPGTSVRFTRRLVRGYLRETSELTSEIRRTAGLEPHLFWYLHNGITIIANETRSERNASEHRIVMKNPQIVNGQQTVREPARVGDRKSFVLVRLIVLASDAKSSEGIRGIVSRVVRSTNRQNSVSLTDLMCNDSHQGWLERELRKRGYYYVRKRTASKEITKIVGLKLRRLHRTQLANIMASAEIGAHLVGRETCGGSQTTSACSGPRSASAII